jgi:uncharacterized protein YciI
MDRLPVINGTFGIQNYNLMKILVWMVWVLPLAAMGQTHFPDFLEGTWKKDNTEEYERWDKAGQNRLKGISYTLVDGNQKISEYLEIVQEKKKVIYKATVLSQNNGNTIPFTLRLVGKSYIFENPKHDFPKKIQYTRTGDHSLLVQVSDGDKNGFSAHFTKIALSQTEKDSSIQNPRYDAFLANKLGGDPYGMKGYVFVILKTGPNTNSDKEFISNSFKDHMSNIKRLAEEKKLVVAGPLQKNDLTYRGIFILNTRDFEEAKAMMEPDTAIREGLLEAVLFQWYGSAALSEYLDASDKIWKKSF